MRKRGREWEYVFLVGAIDEEFSLNKIKEVSWENEKRKMYVAITRASSQ